MSAPPSQRDAMAEGFAVSGPLADLYEGTLDCVHCGLCLPACPTYLETGRETSSPRGRIFLMRGAAEGRIPLEGTLAEEAYLCLGCRACETACPSGVAFGHLVEGTRAAVEAQGLRTGPAKRIEHFVLRQVIPRADRLRWAMGALALVQFLRLDRLVRPLLPRRLRELAARAPTVPPHRERAALPALTPARGERRGRVALFRGCVMPELFGAVNAATVRVLTHNGFDVVVPDAQGCCGALHAHAGDPEFARQLAVRNVAAFGLMPGPERADAAPPFDAVIVNSAGCGAALRDADTWLGPEGERLAGAVRDVCEFLDEVGLRPPTQEVPGRLCYDDPCHLIHGQGVRDAPRNLLAQIGGLELVPHADPGACCGAAGIYNLTHPEMSDAVLERKVSALAASDPDWVATGNPGCLLQLRQGAKSNGLRARIVHPVELLDRAYGNG